ncbi:b(0,+)-type amino acid transporter 1-like isoform X2 [Acanthaster planci]|uniref:b(0,+)-type amino acid transporter 1 n=1 Tax=Acanthaster planci TaxID=133434 RepID=A0A8B7XR12_ACAPL|nr:b(0,+)-type amino acid transporter 1-like isoform X2 [Acanthaster planci]
MTEVREREGRRGEYSLEPKKNGGTEALEKKAPLDGDGVSVGDGKGVKLKRQVGLISGIALIVGTMIGSGIFVSPKGVLTQTDSVGMSLVVWLLCGILATMGALCYAELGTVVPKSGAEYAYLWTLGPVPAYLFAWTSTIVIKPSSLSIIALAFGAYVAEPFFSGECGPPQIAIKMFAALAILLIVFINCASVKWATSVQNFFTAAKILALIIIIVVGFVKLIQGEVRYLSPSVSFTGSSTNVFAYGIAFYQGLWAYDGWNQLNYITEELVKPYRNLPLAIIIGIPLVTILYLLVNIAYFTVMSPEELLQSGAVAVTFANRTLGVMSWLMPVAVACSTFGAANGTCFTAGRLTFVAAREGHMVEILSMVHVKRYTPFPALAFQSFIALLMLLPGDFETLVNYFSFAAWLFYGGTVAALLVLRYRHPEWHRPIKVPIVIPIIVLIASVYLVIAPIIDEPALEYLFAFLFILAGLIFYVPFVHYKYELPFMKHITVFFQLLLEVAPTSYFETEELQNA